MEDRFTILVVEDNPDIRKALCLLLSKEGYSVREADCCAAGLSSVRESPPDLILLDVDLPDGDGRDLCKTIKSDRNLPSILVVHLSATYTSTESQIVGLESGADGYITQPVDNNELLARTRSFLRIKAAENALRESEEKFRAIADTTADAIVLTDSSMCIEYLNRAAERMFGYTTDELLGKGGSIFIPDRRRDGFIESFENFRRSGNEQQVGRTIETILQKKSGEEFPAETTLSQWTRNGENYFCNIIRDISERKLMEEHALKTKTLEATGMLAGGIAHDFNNILSVILGNISLAKEEVDNNEWALSLLDTAEMGCLQARDLANKFLTFSSGGTPQKKPTRIQELAEKAAEFVVLDSPVTCRYNFPENLWLVDTDQAQISEVLMSVVENAKDAMPRGGTVTITAENITHAPDNADPGLPLPRGRYVALTVKDRGKGIPKEIMGKIFEPYFSTKIRGSQKGMGLGLSTANSIITRHKGHIAVVSKPGSGAHVSIYLPALSPETGHRP